MLRNGKRKESLKRRSEVEGDGYALVCPEWYFPFSLSWSKSCRRLGESPTSIERQAWACPGQGQTVAAKNAHRVQPASHLPQAATALFMFVCSVGFPPSASTGIASAAQPLWRVRQHTQVSGDSSSSTMWPR